MKKIISALAALLLAAGGVFITASAASAHTPNHSVTCETITVNLTQYETRPGNATPNKIEVTYNGNVALDWFGTSFQKSYTFADKYAANAWQIKIDAVGGAGDTQYDVTYSGTTTPCQQPEPPFDWNWEYAAPSCTALTVVYPANIPAGQANDVNIRIKNLTTNAETTLNFHNNSGTWSGTQVFTYSSHPNWPGWDYYAVTWVQVAGTNYHWSGSVTCGEQPPVIPPQPEPKVTVTYSEFGGGEPSCEEPTVTWTRTKTTTTTPYKLAGIEWVLDTENATSVTVTDEVTETHEYDGDCELPPTDPPVTEEPPVTELPTPEPSDELAYTGASDNTPLGLAGLGLLLAGAAVFLIRRLAVKH